MIYGLNFNGTHIPPGYAKKFRPRISMTTLTKKRVMASLKGVCETQDELEDMLRVAQNGSRKAHVETRRIVGGFIFGVYCY